MWTHIFNKRKIKYNKLSKIPVLRQRLSIEAVFDPLPSPTEFSNFLYDLSNVLQMTPIENSLRFLNVTLPGDLGTGQHISLNWVTSGVSWYIWHKYNFATLEIYTCKPFDEHVAVHYLLEYLPIIDWKKA